MCSPARGRSTRALVLAAFGFEALPHPRQLARLRHSSATELLTEGIGPSRESGLDHRDRRAAEIMGLRMPKRPTQRHVAAAGGDPNDIDGWPRWAQPSP